MQITVLQAVLLGFACFLVSTGMFPLGWLSQNIMSKPLISCAIVGIIMGDVATALKIGVVIQAAYIGQMSIGGVQTLPNINTSLWFALPMTMVSGGDAAYCLTMCLAFSALHTFLNTLATIVKIGFMHKFDDMIEKGKIGSHWMFPATSHIWTFCYAMVFVTGFCLVGTGAITSLVDMLPAWLNKATTTFTGLLPAIGFMMLMVTMIKNNFQWLYFLLGFYLAAGLGWSTIAVTVLACVIAYMIYQFTPSTVAAVEEDDD